MAKHFDTFATVFFYLSQLVGLRTNFNRGQLGSSGLKMEGSSYSIEPGGQTGVLNNGFVRLGPLDKLTIQGTEIYSEGAGSSSIGSIGRAVG